MFKSFTDRLPALGTPGRGTVAEADLPETMRWAVKLMTVGAAISTVFAIFGVVVTLSERNSIVNSLISWNNSQPKSKRVSLNEIHSYVTVSIATIIIIGLISVALWLWMARMNTAGRSWARVVATVLFVLWTYYTYENLGGTRGSAVLIVSMAIVLVIWVVGVASLFLLWRQPSSEFFRSRSSR
jgi:uncharacterized membrane protein